MSKSKFSNFLREKGLIEEWFNDLVVIKNGKEFNIGELVDEYLLKNKPKDPPKPPKSRRIDSI